MKRYVVACGEYYFVGTNTANKEIILKKGFMHASIFNDINKAKKIAESVGGKVKQLTLTNPE